MAFNFELDVRRLGGAEVVVEGVEHVEVQAAAGGRGVVELCSGRQVWTLTQFFSVSFFCKKIVDLPGD